MTTEDEAGDGGAVLTLQMLIQARKRERGWTDPDLQRRSHGRVSRQRWAQLSAGEKLTKFPDPATLMAIAEALDAEPTNVLIATGQSVGMPVRFKGPALLGLIPHGVELLSPNMLNGFLAMMRAAVIERMETLEALGVDADSPITEGNGPIGRDFTLEWQDSPQVTKGQRAVRSNTTGHVGENPA